MRLSWGVGLALFSLGVWGGGDWAGLCSKSGAFMGQFPKQFLGSNLFMAFQNSRMYFDPGHNNEARNVYFKEPPGKVVKLNVFKKSIRRRDQETRLLLERQQFRLFADSPRVVQMKWCVYEGEVSATSEERFLSHFLITEFYIQTFSTQPGKRSVLFVYRDKLSVKQRLQVWLQMALCLQEIHLRGFVHGALRPESFAVLRSDFSVIKLAELGVAGVEGPVRIMSLQFFVPAEGYERPEERKPSFDIYALSAVFATLELGYQTLKNVQDFFHGAENTEKYNNMLVSAIIKGLIRVFQASVPRELLLQIIKVVTDGLHFKPSRRPKIEDLVFSLTTIISLIDLPQIPEPQKIVKADTGSDISDPGDQPQSPKDGQNAMGEALKPDVIQEIEESPTFQPKPQDQVQGDLGVPKIVVKEAKSQLKSVVGGPSRTGQSPQDSLQVPGTLPVDKESEDRYESAEKGMSPMFSEYLERERLRRESQASEEEIAREDIDDFRDVVENPRTYGKNNPWPFFSVLIGGAFCISGSLFYWALE